jgi:hypothetical protein
MVGETTLMILSMIGGFIVYLIPAIISALAFYFSVTKVLKNKLISFFISLILLFISIYILDLFIPITNFPTDTIAFTYTIFYHRIRSPFSVFMALIFIVLLDIKNYQIRLKKK